MTNSILTTPPRRKHSRSVTLFALAVLYLGLVNLARAWLALNGSPFERALPLAAPLPYFGLGGLLWGAAFAVIAFGLWRVRPWARKAMLGAVLIYQLHIWINHFIFDSSVYSRQVWPFEAGLSLAWIMVVWGLLFLPDIKRLYSKT